MILDYLFHRFYLREVHRQQVANQLRRVGATRLNG
jgi:hypothetical protein